MIGRSTARAEDLPLQENGVELDAKESARFIANTFYPEDLEDADSVHHRRIRRKAEEVNAGNQSELWDPEFTLFELKASVDSFNPRKAPGADGFTADICRYVIEDDPVMFQCLFNKCLALHHFPKPWKEATVMMLRKPGRCDYTTPKSLRPIGLLPILGKILEKMLVGRLKHHLLPRMSALQYGFMPQKSTEDSLYDLMQYIRNRLRQKEIITIVSLDIEGAFDSAWWPAIRVRLAEEKCPLNLRLLLDSYLEHRSVRVRYAGAEHSKRTSKGCVQGSIGGPILWNLLLDPLLKSLETGGNYCQAFADDIVLIFHGETAGVIQERANAALGHVWEWGVANKLTFAPHKTMAMTITNRLKYDIPRLSMGGVGVGTVKEMKLLGVIIDEKLTFNSHVTYICKKAIGIYKQLTRAAKTSWGLHPEVTRIIYVATMEPIILYGASAWSTAANKAGVRKQLNVLQRGMAQKLCRAYRTVSLNSALVLAGILPLDLRIRETALLYESKRGIPWEALGDRVVERMSRAIDAPHPAEHQIIDIKKIVDQEQYLQSGVMDVKLFTDGSKIAGKVGAAITIWTNETEINTIKLALSNYCTVYQAELLALCRATKEITMRYGTVFGVYSDSMAALQALQNPLSLHPLAVTAREHLRTASLQNKAVTLFWIKAHAGIEGNERADELAKAAAGGSKRRPDYDLCPVSFVRGVIRDATLDEWNERYKAETTASVTKIFLPDAKRAYSVVRKFEATSVRTQIMTGHGGFSEYLTRFRCKENPACICDPEKSETVLHILFDCPVHSGERYKIEQELSLKLDTTSVATIMASKDRDRLLEYCTKIATIVINRNK